MIYEIKLKREIWNGILHIVVGVIISHVFLAYLPLWALLGILMLLGAGREYWQYRRHKIQPLYIQIIDTLTLMLGGFLWWLFVNVIFHINVDVL